MRTWNTVGFIGLTVLSTINCGSPGPGPDEPSTGTTAGASDSSLGSSSGPGPDAGSAGSDSSGGEQCMKFASTNEGCQIGGPSPGMCPDAPKGWVGTAAPGEACSSGTECKGIICKCADPVQQWYVGVCACDVCADYDVACAEGNVVSCKMIAPQ